MFIIRNVNIGKKSCFIDLSYVDIMTYYRSIKKLTIPLQTIDYKNIIHSKLAKIFPCG